MPSKRASLPTPLRRCPPLSNSPPSTQAPEGCCLILFPVYFFSPLSTGFPCSEISLCVLFFNRTPDLSLRQKALLTPPLTIPSSAETKYVLWLRPAASENPPAPSFHAFRPVSQILPEKRCFRLLRLPGCRAFFKKPVCWFFVILSVW